MLDLLGTIYGIPGNSLGYGVKMAFGFWESEIVSVEMCFKLEAPGIGTNPEILGRHTTGSIRTLC